MNANERIAQQGGQAQRLKGHGRTANPYPPNSALFELWDTAWCDEDDRLRKVIAETLLNTG